MLPGETIHSGAPMECNDVDFHEMMGEGRKALPLVHEVMSTPAGYYWGTSCPACGPFSRESDYYPTREQAENDPDYKPRS